MPELPEVETVRRRLAPLVVGRRVVRAELLDPRLTAPEPPADVAARIEGRSVVGLGRRGKYLLVRLDDGAVLIVHLRMTGNLLHHPPSTPPAPAHVRARLTLDDATRVEFHDVRRFGTWDLLEDGAAADAYLEARLGPEPLDGAFGPRVLRRALSTRRAPVKAVLLDQRVVAGVGNIYADEALHRARVHPETPADRVPAAAVPRIVAAVRAVLETGIEAQGASIRDYRTPGGDWGSMQERFLVFGRDGEPCLGCGREIVKLRVAGRGTHVCPGCQRRRPGNGGVRRRV